MKKAILSLAAAALIAGPSMAQDAWSLDKSHSGLQFNVTHMMLSEVSGTFNDFDIVAASSKADHSDLVVTFTAKTASVNTNNEKRDGHLKSDDFFNSEAYPDMVFKSSSVKVLKDGKMIVMGDLTIRDKTKPVSIAVVNNGTIKDPYGMTRTAFKATATINRFDYDLKWNSLMEGGGAVVGKDIVVNFNGEFVRKK